MTESGVIMDPTLVCTVQTCQEFATRKTTFGSICGAIKSMMDAPEIIAKRLKALRKELGYKTQVEFAAKLGIDKSTYNPFETGTRPLTFETARVRYPHRLAVLRRYAAERPANHRQDRAERRTAGAGRPAAPGRIGQGKSLLIANFIIDKFA